MEKRHISNKRETKSFIMHENIIRMSSQLSNEDLAKLIRQIYQYIENGQTPAEQPNLALTIIFKEWQLQYEKDKEQYEHVCKCRKEASQKRWKKTNTVEKVKVNTANAPATPDNSPVASDYQAEEAYHPQKEKEKEKDKVKESGNPAPALDARKLAFYQSILPYTDQYDREMLNDFYQYWTELDKRRRRMRFEMQKTWETSKRLSTWARRENKIS